MARGRNRQVSNILCVQGGFTLIELAISLGVSLLLLSGCLSGLLVVQQEMARLKSRQSLQAEAASFIQYLESEAKCTDKYYISSEKLYFYHGADRLDYKKIGNTVVRQRNGGGYVTVCYHVNELRMRPVGSGVEIKLTLSQNGIQWQVTAVIFPYAMA